LENVAENEGKGEEEEEEVDNDDSDYVFFISSRDSMI
jgi:hypothetical protein